MPLNTLSQVYNTTAIKAIPNQNNNLLEFVGTAGTTVASVTPGGALDLRSSSGNPITGNPNDASVIGNKIHLWSTSFGIGIQNARLVLYHDSSSATSIRTSLTGADVIRFQSDGNVAARYLDSLNNNGPYVDLGIGAGPIIVIGRVAAQVPFAVRGAASQSANLQEWQNSAGTAATVVNSAGILGVPRINFTGGSTTISAVTLADGTVSFEGTAGQLFSVSNSLTGTIFSINDISGLPSVEVTDLGIIKLNELYGQTVIGSGTPATNAQLSAIARTAATIPLVARGATSQSANLQEWQNSAGTVLGYIRSDGGIYITGSSDNRLYNLGIGGSSTNISWLYVTPASANQKPVVIRGTTSQTANLQEWQNSAATVLSSIDSAGIFSAPGLISSSQPAQINNTVYGFHISPAANLGATTYWKIATLPATTLATYDAIYIEALLGSWASTGKTRYEILMANRDSFTYKHRVYGPGLTQARILAYTETSGEISVYLYSENTYTNLSYNISLVYPTTGTGTGATIFRNPTGSTVAPTGTLAFDSSSGTYPSLLNIDNSGNALLLGNVASQNSANPRVRAIRTAATAQTSGLGADNGVGWVGSETNTPFYLTTNNTERMRIDASGNVNIGPATPAGGGTNTGGLSIRGKDIEIMNIMGVY